MRRTSVVLLVVLALFLGACGGGGKRLTRSEFLKQGNAICEKGNKDLDAAGKKAFPNQNQQPTTAQVKTFFERSIIPRIDQELDDIDDLKPPKDLEDDIDKLLTDARAAVDKMKDLADKDPEKLLSDESDPFKDVNKRATDLGLTVCGEP